MVRFGDRLRRLEGQLSPPDHGGRPCCHISPEQLEETKKLSKEELAASIVRDMQEAEERLKRDQPEEYTRREAEWEQVQHMSAPELAAYLVQRISQRRSCCFKAH